MNRPNPKAYSPKDHLRGKYSDDLEKYMKSEGCSCCQDTDAHKDHTKRLAELLKVPAYADGSGYEFHNFQTY